MQITASAVSLNVEDVAASCAFFTEHFGFRQEMAADETRLENLISLCKRHHALVHDTGTIISAAGGTFTFFAPDGTPIPDSPPLPGGTVDGLKESHHAALEWHTIIPPHSGERLDLRMAIWICFHNIKVQAQRREQEQSREQVALAT